MSVQKASTDDIARVAHAIWEAEGRPEGRDHYHWMRARQLIEEGRAEAEFPEAVASGDAEPEPASRPVQPGFEDVPPGIVPKMKHDTGREEPGGRFAKQIDELPGEPPEVGPAESETPGPRNPAPMPPTNAEGFVAIPSVDDAAGRALSDNPVPPPGNEDPQGAR
jgi:Protein of unknown function (DUF2934)